MEIFLSERTNHTSESKELKVKTAKPHFTNMKTLMHALIFQIMKYLQGVITTQLD